MKSNKTLKYTGIIQGVLIATLLLLAIWIQVTFLYNYYCEDSSFWAIHGDYPVLFIFNTLFTTFASFSSLSGNYVLYVIFEIMDIASLVLPVYLVYKSIRSKSTMANGLIIISIISSAVTFMIMVAYGVYTLLDIIRGAETFNIYSIIFIFIMLIKVTLCIVSQLRIKAINNAVE